MILALVGAVIGSKLGRQMGERLGVAVEAEIARQVAAEHQRQQDAQAPPDWSFVKPTNGSTPVVVVLHSPLYG